MQPTNSMQVTVPPDVREVVDTTSVEAAAAEAVRRVEYRRQAFPVGSGQHVVVVRVFDGVKHHQVEVRGQPEPHYEAARLDSPLFSRSG